LTIYGHNGSFMRTPNEKLKKKIILLDQMHSQQD
jgi:hypothetical protein